MIRLGQKECDVHSAPSSLLTCWLWPGSWLRSSRGRPRSFSASDVDGEQYVQEGSHFSGTIFADGGSVFQGNVSGGSVNISGSIHLNHKGCRLMLSDFGDSLRKNILDWLSPLSFKDKQAAVFSSRRPGTGSRFLATDAFQSWSHGKKGSTLLCPGIRKMSQLVYLLRDILIDATSGRL